MLFQEKRIGPVNGVHLQGLLEGGAVGRDGMVYGVMDPQKGIDMGNGWVGPSANRYAAVDDAAEAVGGAVMGAQALLIHASGIAPQPLIAGLHTQDHS